jgi:hypothetical protein
MDQLESHVPVDPLAAHLKHCQDTFHSHSCQIMSLEMNETKGKKISPKK